MKNKSMRLLLASAVTVLGLSGFTSCDSNNPTGESTQSVVLTDLTLGYKVTGTGGLGWDPEVESIEFCGSDASIYFPDIMETETWGYFVTGEFDDEIGFDWYEDYLNTTTAGTPGTLDVGVTYSMDQGTDTNSWTITSIEEVECTPNPT